METTRFAKRIGIVMNKLESSADVRWDADLLYSGSGGAEEAVIYAAQELASRGIEVIVFGHPPLQSVHSQPTANPRYLDISHLPDTKLDIAIVKCIPSMGPIVKMMTDKVYFWPHGWKRVAQNEIDSFDGVMWLTKYQRDYYVSLFPAMSRFNTVFGNGINPNQFFPIVERTNPYSCIYANSYVQGLNMVLDQWTTLKAKYPQATLDIYYGWNDVSEDLKKALQKQLAELYELDVREHGQVSYAEIHHVYSRASFWLFPSTIPETFCISALKAQYAGAIPAIYRWAGLNETVKYGLWCLDLSGFAKVMMTAMERAESISIEMRKSMRAFIDENYTWRVVIDRWLEYFDE